MTEFLTPQRPDSEDNENLVSPETAVDQRILRGLRMFVEMDNDINANFRNEDESDQPLEDSSDSPEP